MKLTLYDLAEFGGAHVRLKEECPLTGMNLVHGELVALLTIPLKWQTMLSFDFKFADHINLLEALALVTLFQRLKRTQLMHRRVIVLIDSGVVKGAATKGRSSSRRLNAHLRRLSALLLSRDLYVELLWIPSAANSSDAPSRHYPVWKWRLEALELWSNLAKKFSSYSDWCAISQSLTELLSPNEREQFSMLSEVAPTDKLCGQSIINPNIGQYQSTPTSPTIQTDTQKTCPANSQTIPLVQS